MTYPATTPSEYIQAVDAERRAAFLKLREVVSTHIPTDFQEEMSYGMIGYVVPHTLYPAGYHCDPQLPLPFVSIAAQKNFIALYHMGMYASPELLNWWVSEFPKHSKHKLDMGKSCIRFKNVSEIPFDLVAQLMQKMTADQWIDLYKTQFKR